MQTHKVSLVIPAYNEEKYIGNCLRHAIENSQGLFSEIIVVDNASTDKTASIVKDFPTVKLIHEYRKGPTFARERGFKESTGNIIAFIDADTQMTSTWAKQLIQEFEHNQNLACLSGPYSYFDFPKWKQIVINTVFWYIGVKPSSILIGNVVIGGNFAIRRDVLEKMSGFDTTIAFYGDDTDIGRRAKEFGDVNFNLKFIMPSSARRFEKQGVIKCTWLYVINYLAEIFIHRPITEKYIDVR